MEVKVAGIVLAGGMSRRMGAFKPLLTLEGKTFIERVVEMFAGAEGIGTITVVTGCEAERVRTALSGANVRFAHNAEFASGEMLSSVKAGVRSLPQEESAFVLALVDQPRVQSATVGKLIDAWRASQASLIIPMFKGRRGHPVLFSMKLREEILALAEHETLKTVVLRHFSEARIVEVDDSGISEDIDTKEQYEAIRAGRL